MELVTGKGATDHVSSADMASLYRGLLIADDAVLDTGDKLACTMLDANTAEIGTGDCMLQAHHARVEVAEQLTIRSGSQGFNRNDLIVARYTLGDNNVQSVYLAVIEGTAVAGTASDPAYAEGDIDAGDTLVEFPIWRIPISGVNVGTPERVMPTVDTLQSQISANDADIATNTAAIATNTADIATLRDSVCLPKGTYSINGLIIAGYISGSGNFFTFDFPFRVDASSISLSDVVATFFYYDGVKTDNVQFSATGSSILRNQLFVKTEFRFASMQSKASTVALASFIGGTVTFS